MGSDRYTPVKAILIFSMMMATSLVLSITDENSALKYLDLIEDSATAPHVFGEVVHLGDLDQDTYEDIALTFPTRDSNGPGSGSVALFWGDEDGFPPLDIGNADLLLNGYSGSLFGQSIAAWDQSGNGYKDLVVGAPNSNNGTGSVYIFNSNLVNGALSGSSYTPGWADIEVTLDGSHFFGCELHAGAMSEDDLDDLMVLSFGNGSVGTKAAFFMGGLYPDRPYEIDLDNGSVNNKTRSISMDLSGTGIGSYIYSSPDRGVVNIVQMGITYDSFSLPGANSTGIVDFNGSIEEQGNSWGLGAGDDGWDISPYHVYDGDSGDDYVRWNEASGNPRGHDRSVSNTGMLFIEVGGDLDNSGGTDQSGAYGTSFFLSEDNLTDINSVLLSFDYVWEDWGFESNERMWVKTRLTNSSGATTWLGRNVDTDVSNDITNEVYTMKGVNGGGGVGRELFGSGTFQEDVFSLIDGPGEYYLDMGGKISRWTQPNEFGGFGFDNISLVFRSLDHDIRTITGAGQLGTSLLAADIGGDDLDDLVVSSPQDGRIRIFNGSEPYWSIKAMNQNDANYTIEGPSGTEFGNRLLLDLPSPFRSNHTLLVGELQGMGATGGSGLVHRFPLPLTRPLTMIDDSIDVNYPPDGVFFMGMDMVSIGDRDGNGYPEVLFFGWNASSRLVYVRADGSPSPPELKILFPKRHATVSGLIGIEVKVMDVDGDSGPMDVRYFRSIDNRSWIPMGDGLPDRIEGDVAIKDWDTTSYENSGYFFKVSVTDGFGLTTSLFTDRLDVFNHAPPFVDLTFPNDGSELRGNEQVSARISVPSDEVLQMPVRFYLSRDNETWVEFGNRTTPSGIGGLDYSIVIDTRYLEDGEIWFRVNATTEYGLGREDWNIEPAFINNFYPPDVNITSPISNTTLKGTVNITAVVTDIDDDILEPVIFKIKSADDELFDEIGNMTYLGNDTYSFIWDTTTVSNGWYDLMVLAGDETFLQTSGVLNASVYIRNLFTPSIRITGVSTSDIITGFRTITATVTDPDRNFKARNIRFDISSTGSGQWISMGGTIPSENSAKLTWDSSSVMNGEFDIKASITDDDNLTAIYIVEGVIVRNPYDPMIHTALPDPNIKLSGTVRLNFTVSDDQPLPPGSVKVEISTLGEWVELESVVRVTTGGAFIPWMNISFYVEWDTEEVSESGIERFPDGPGYDVRITVTDSENLSVIHLTKKSYEIMNREETVDDDDAGNDGLGLPGWAIALIALSVILLLVFLFLFFVLWSGRKKEKEAPTIDASDLVRKQEPEAEEEVSQQTDSGDLYSTGGWGASAAPMTTPEETPYSTDIDVSSLDLGLDLIDEDISDVGAPMEKEARPEAPKREISLDLDEGVEVDLPAGVMPSSDEVSGDWDELEEEEELDEVDDWEDVEEEDEWEDLEDEEWEDVEEEEEEDEWDEDEDDMLTVTCKCGEDIEIPSDFEGSRFRCPECGRKGRIPGR